jgi:hypothetical protein
LAEWDLSVVVSQRARSIAESMNEDAETALIGTEHGVVSSVRPVTLQILLLEVELQVSMFWCGSGEQSD